MVAFWEHKIDTYLYQTIWLRGFSAVVSRIVKHYKSVQVTLDTHANQCIPGPVGQWRLIFAYINLTWNNDSSSWHWYIISCHISFTLHNWFSCFLEKNDIHRDKPYEILRNQQEMMMSRGISYICRMLKYTGSTNSVHSHGFTGELFSNWLISQCSQLDHIHNISTKRTGV